MRKLLLVLVIASVGNAACSKTPATPTTPTPPVATCTYALSTTTFNIAGAGGSATMTVNTGPTCAWTVSTGSPFLSVITVGRHHRAGQRQLHHCREQR